MIGAHRRRPHASTSTGDTLCDPRAPDPARRDVRPEPGHRRRHRARDRRGPREARSTRSSELAIEDPSFRVRTDPETGQIVIPGMGELHLEIVVDRLRREFKVEARVGQPQVAYRETVTRRAEGENKFVRVRSPAAARRVRPRPARRRAHRPRRRLRLREPRLRRRTSRRSTRPPSRRGSAEAVERGVLAGHPMTDLRVQVVGGSYHPVDSNEYAFKVAGSQGVRRSGQQGGARPSSSR